MDSRLPQGWHLPLALNLPLFSLVMAASTWLLCSLLARRLGRASLLRALLLRVRLLLVGGAGEPPFGARTGVEAARRGVAMA